MKKITVLLLCLTMLALSGCSLFEKIEPETTTQDENISSEAPIDDEPVFDAVNPLTGTGMHSEKSNARPVAVMINNINVAQSVQAGVNKADIVYETEVEGGITRLMAVFKDISSAGQIGTIRSARYAYVDLAAGHHAVYAHCGQDKKYCAPHLKDIDDVSVDTGSYGGKRISNGLSREHTLYTFGDKFFEALKNSKIDATAGSESLWQNFASEDEKVELTDGTCQSVTVPFSNQSVTVFNYDSSKEKYVRSSGNTVRKDYVTGETTDVKNVFVLLTSISNYPDGEHREVSLQGGEGYYFSNGGYAKINWSKGYTNNPLKFTDLNGNPLKVNAGNSYVCIADKRTSQPVIK